MSNSIEKKGKLDKTFEKPLTRRSFLKKSTTGAAVASACSTFNRAPDRKLVLALLSPGSRV